MPSERKANQRKAKRIMTAVAAVLIGAVVAFGCLQIIGHNVNFFTDRQVGVGATAGNIQSITRAQCVAAGGNLARSFCPPPKPRCIERAPSFLVNAVVRPGPCIVWARAKGSP